MNKPTLLILAAGMGSRYGGLKQLDGVGPDGETIMDYSVYDSLKSGFGKVVFVIRKSFSHQFIKRAEKLYGRFCSDLAFVEQEPDNLPEGFSVPSTRIKPWGTGHAVLVAAGEISTPFAAINADDFYGRGSFQKIQGFLSQVDLIRGNFCMVGFRASNTLSPSGSVSRGVCSVDRESMLISVEEHHNIKEENGIIRGEKSPGENRVISPETAVSMNMWGFTPDIFEKAETLFREFLVKNKGNDKAEFYIPSVVDSLLKSGDATCKVLTTDEKWFGVTYKEDREEVSGRLRSLTAEGHYPSPLFL
ncbi:MAG: nucleotidyltransferase [Bacteroidales bacterium]|nr:nucleotidyltransferase [Bacteroidales bacterium]MDD2425072.1 nucleotidyltransferase [Bacteroidales bacterium]MDD3988619.1 nucleotidyltransferase [Bacteroidales bacterium]